MIYIEYVQSVLKLVLWMYLIDFPNIFWVLDECPRHQGVKITIFHSTNGMAEAASNKNDK